MVDGPGTPTTRGGRAGAGASGRPDESGNSGLATQCLLSDSNGHLARMGGAGYHYQSKRRENQVHSGLSGASASPSAWCATLTPR